MHCHQDGLVWNASEVKTEEKNSLQDKKIFPEGTL
jgi:hypothetical protein